MMQGIGSRHVMSNPGNRDNCATRRQQCRFSRPPCLCRGSGRIWRSSLPETNQSPLGGRAEFAPGDEPEFAPGDEAKLAPGDERYPAEKGSGSKITSSRPQSSCNRSGISCVPCRAVPWRRLPWSIPAKLRCEPRLLLHFGGGGGRGCGRRGGLRERGAHQKQGGNGGRGHAGRQGHHREHLRLKRRARSARDAEPRMNEAASSAISPPRYFKRRTAGSVVSWRRWDRMRGGVQSVLLPILATSSCHQFVMPQGDRG